VCEREKKNIYKCLINHLEMMMNLPVLTKI
jgi:hypothetical protein